MKQQVVRCALGMLVVLSGAGAYALPYFDNFNDGNLDGWTPVGATASGGWAVLTDSADEAYLYHQQPLALTSPGDLVNGHYWFHFDFNNTFGTPGQGNSDLFAVSLCFTNSADPVSSFDNLWSLPSVIGVMDEDYTSISNYGNPGDMEPGTYYDGPTSVSPLGEGWTRYWLGFDTTSSYVIPVFELFNLNGTAGDSTVQIDNVGVPEPLSMVMLGCLGAGMLGARKIRRRKTALSA
jgi:hypothetical protein